MCKKGIQCTLTEYLPNYIIINHIMIMLQIRIQKAMCKKKNDISSFTRKPCTSTQNKQKDPIFISPSLGDIVPKNRSSKLA